MVVVVVGFICKNVCWELSYKFHNVQLVPGRVEKRNCDPREDCDMRDPLTADYGEFSHFFFFHLLNFFFSNMKVAFNETMNFECHFAPLCVGLFSIVFQPSFFFTLVRFKGSCFSIKHFGNTLLGI